MDTHNLKYIISFLLLILFIGACSESVDISGCPYPDSCNYNPDGTDEDSCWYPDEGCLCEDGEDAILDCAGECNGNALEDCAGICNGNTMLDECNVCGGPGQVALTNFMIGLKIEGITPFGGFWYENSDNYFGINENASDGYDAMDIPEPPTFDTNWAKIYFYNPDDISPFGDNFTQEIKSNTSCNFKEWNMVILSNFSTELWFQEPEILPNTLSSPFFFWDRFTFIEVEDDIEIIHDASSFFSTNYSLEANIPKQFFIRLAFD